MPLPLQRHGEKGRVLRRGGWLNGGGGSGIIVFHIQGGGECGRILFATMCGV